MTHKDIARLSGRHILANLEGHAAAEHRGTVGVLLYLNQVERRQLHQRLGFSSMFAFCTDRLRYSAPAAGRRIQSARLVCRYPNAYRMLRRREVNLSTLSMIAGIITPQNSKGLLAEMRNRSTREVEAIKSQYTGPVRVRDRVRPVMVAVPVKRSARVGQSPWVDASWSGASNEPRGPERDAASSGPVASASLVKNGATIGAESERHRATTEPKPEVLSTGAISGKPFSSDSGQRYAPPFTLQKKVAVTVVVDPAFMNKLEQARDLLAHRFAGRPTFEQALGCALDLLLEKHDPVRRAKRREARRTTRTNKQITTNNTKAHHTGTRATGTRSRGTEPNRAPHRATHATATRTSRATSRRAIPTAVRDRVFVRDGGTCTYIGDDGHRCASTHCLQMDHRVPVARGGSSDISNLRLLCAAHNRLESERVLGASRTTEHGTVSVYPRGS